MTLPRVSVMAAAGEAPTVTVNGSPIAGVRSAQVTVTDGGVPQVSLVLNAAEVDLQLPAAVTVLTAGPTASDFAQQLSPARLEAAAIQQLEVSEGTQGEAFTAAVQVMASEFDDRG